MACTCFCPPIALEQGEAPNGSYYLNHGYKCKREEATVDMEISPKLRLPPSPLFPLFREADLHDLVSETRSS